MEEEKEFQVQIPEEKYQLLNFEEEELPGIAVVNQALADFEPKEVFSWHCSVIIDIQDQIENGMPSKEEVTILDEFGDFLDDKIKGSDKEKPNALFLARLTWNGTRQLIWRVYDPDMTNEFLTDLIDRKDYPREFDYQMQDDEDWELATWYLQKNE